jgi:hypothetical protein
VQPGYTLTLDLVKDAVTCQLDNGANRSSYTVSNRDPAHVVIDASYGYRAPHPTLDIRIEATCQTTSDAISYSHMAQVEVLVNGRRHFCRSWTAAVSRWWS